jgi:ParB family transcriptional regulator, chromosome partitioning protein
MEINTENQNKKRLGRGLGSLLGGGVAAAENNLPASVSAPAQQVTNTQVAHVDSQNRIWSMAIDKLVPGQYQPRKKFEKTTLEELAQSIRENGILQPITVRKRAAGGFEIIAGERRWRAAQIAGLHEVPAIIKEYSDREALQLALIENIQREDLDAVEEAESYQRLMQEFGYSQSQVAEKVGKERSTVANSIRLIGLPNEIKDMISDKKISVGHAKVLLAAENKAEQIRLAKICFEKSLSVRALEGLMKPSAPASAENKNNDSKNILTTATADLPQRLAKELAEQLQKTLGTKVFINYKAGKGDLTIHFYSDEQLNSIYEKINS